MRVTTFISARFGVTLALAVGAFVVGLAPLSDGDLWWHLAAGREIARTHAPPAVDSFSSGAAGRPWIDVHWGFQLAAYAIHVAGGLRALILTKCAVVAAGALLLASAAARAAGPRARTAFAVVFLLALFAARGLLLVRPVIPTLLFATTFFWLLERFRSEGRATWLAPLPLLQVAWSNVQGLSMLGPALIAAYAVSFAASARWGERPWFPFVRERATSGGAGRLALVLGLCVAACAATPYGLAGLALPFDLLRRLVPGAGNVYTANVAENVPPWLLERAAPGQMSHLVVFLMFVATSFVVARRLAFGHLLIVAGLVALALAANRNVLLLYWLATPIAVIAVAPSLRRVRVAIARGRGGPRVARWSGRFALAGGLALAAVAAAREPGLAEAAPFRVPAAGADAIAARGGAGTIFAADQYGGYLIWRLGPAFKPFMDTRLVLRTADEYAEYLQLADRPETFDAWEAEHRMDYVLLPVGYPERYLGLVAHLYESERWRLISTDGTEVLFARAELGDESAPIDLGARDVVDGLAAALDRRFDAPAIREAARLQLAALELAVGQPVEAERALAGLAGAAADRVRARCRLAAGDLDGASTLAGRTLASAPDDVGGLGLLAVIEARRGDTTKAVALLRRALEIDPFDAEAGRILAAWEDDHAQSP